MEPSIFNILVVDDDDLVARALKASLWRPDRRVLTCADPREVPEIMATEPVDLVISDENMPNMSGVRLLSDLRESHPDVARVLLTGHATLDTAVQAINTGGVFKFLHKPWDPEELEAVVASALGRAQALRPASRAPSTVERRRAMLAELDREHPGILYAGPGPHELVPDAFAEIVDLLVTRILEGQDSRELRRSAESMVAAASPMALANAFALMALRHSGSLVLDLVGRGHVVSLEAALGTFHLMSLPREIGDLVAARLAVLGNLDLGGMGEQVGRAAFRYADAEDEFIMSFRSSPGGLAAELRRVVGLEIEAEAVPSSESDADYIGRYRVLDVLGYGGLGIVYRGVHEALERPVAIKVLHAGSAQDQLSTARFLREAKAASRACHPGIVQVLDFGQHSDGRFFLVMELVGTPTLEQRLADGPFTLEQAVGTARSIATALGAAHDAGVVHRDLKPSNIFLDKVWHVKLSDFGAAKIVGTAGPALTQEGMTLGTPHYMSPEHARGLPVDRRTDLYALGCVLYEMVSGKPPFEGATALDVLTQHISAPPPSPTSPHGPVPHALARVIRRAMAKNPAERHQTAAELLADLGQAASSLGRTGWRRWLA